MNCKLILVLGLLAVMTAGCSKNSAESGGGDWRQDESLPVPILFGNMNVGVITKAMIPSLDSAIGQPFGVFAWDYESADKMKVSAQSIFQNSYRPAQVFGSAGNYSLKFVNSVKTAISVFYPTTSTNNYSFYSYYSGKEDVSGEYETGDDCYYTGITFDKPFKDILWGRFRDKDLQYDDETLPHLKYNDVVIKGFNARFSRAAAKQTKVPESSYYPEITFKHVSSSCRFYAKADTSMTEEQYEKMKKYLTIDSLTISNVPSAANLIIASRDTTREGVLERVSEAPLVKVRLNVADTVKPVKEGKGKLITDGKEDTFFIVPGEYNSTVTVHTTIGTGGDTSSVSFPFKYKIGAQEYNTFEAGKCYTFVVIFKSIEEIMLKARLSDWVDGAETEITIFD